MSNAVLDALMGGVSYPSAEFATVGTTVGGKIISPPRARQVREYDKANPGKGPLKFYPNSADPIMGVVIDVQAFAAAGEDSGGRRLYADNKRQKEALREALIASGAVDRGLETGGYLSMTWTGEEAGEGAVPAKTWSAVYRTPEQQAAYAATAVQPPAQPAYAPPAPPVAQPAYVPPVDPQQAAFLAWQASQAAQAPPAPPVAAQPAYAQPPAAAVAPVAQAKPQINAVVAAAMANAGVDISQFDIIG